MAKKEAGKKKIGVIGAGPVGCTLAAAFSAAGHEVTLCDVVPELLAPALDPGIRVEGAASFTGKVTKTVRTVDELADAPPDVLFVTVKATALPLISSAIQSFHKPGTAVVSWQNGIDTEAVLAEHLDPDWVFRAVVNLGVNLKAPGHVVMGFHHPPHWVQGMTEASVGTADEIAALLSAAGLPTRRAERIVDRIWQKTILNAALSSVCAITGKTMAQAMGDPILREIIEHLVKEGIDVARANEISVGWDFFPTAIRYLATAGNHKPSMLIDIENRRRTEVDYINGAIVRYAERVRLDAPYNRMARALVKAVEPA